MTRSVKCVHAIESYDGVKGKYRKKTRFKQLPE
jgi:hypothetical protein